MRAKNHTKKTHHLAIKMTAALVMGLIAGLGFLFLREKLLLSNQEGIWNMIYQLLFEDISTEAGSDAFGLFYIIGQLFLNAMQLIIIPMVFTSIALAMCRISDTKKLGRIAYKTVLGFLFTSIAALICAGLVGLIANHLGWFTSTAIGDVTTQSGSTGTNPLLIILNAVPNNITSVLSSNGNVLAVVFLAVVTGLCFNHLGDQIKVFKRLLEEVNQMVTVFLTFLITKFGPLAVFVLITRTFAIYGIEHLKPALAYMGTVFLVSVPFLIFGYSIYIFLFTRLNPIYFIKKMGKVALFAFSMNSSASTLPLNQQTVTKELGVSDELTSFILPLGMTINMNGTAIYQIIATIFIASSAGYEVTLGSILMISVLALISSVGTPAAPGSGTVILFTILTAMGYSNEMTLLTYSLILAINRPIEMVTTSLNVVGDAATALVVAKSEGCLDESIYYTESEKLSIN